MERSTDATQKPQASGNPTRHDAKLHSSTEHPGPSSEHPCFNNHDRGLQFNAPGGTQNNNTGSGYQFLGPVSIRTANGDREEARENKINQILQRLYASPYKDLKDRNPDRIPGTCEWFVSHKLFRKWQESKSSTMLWVSADPGCGKSVLVKYLVDSILPTTDSTTVCYFFFKDDFEDQRNVLNALCCIIRQLFEQKRILLSNAVLDKFDINGKAITSSFSELWEILLETAGDTNAGEIVCLLNAIDECTDPGRSQLTQALQKLYGTQRNFKLKFLLTSRPYLEIRQNLLNLQTIYLSGESEEEMKKISQEIDIFIQARVESIAALLKLEPNVKNTLSQSLLRVLNRTYLWVHLTLDMIASVIDTDKTAIIQVISRLPKTVDEAYDRILSKSRNPEQAKKILHIVVATARPLTLREMTLALALREDHRSYDELDLMSEGRFREHIRDICGLFVTIIDSKIYLLHQTAKEFLVQNDAMNSPGDVHRDLKWKHSLRPQESHLILTEICIWYLLLKEFEAMPQHVEGHPFLDYSAKHWVTHTRELQINTQEEMTSLILRICDARSWRCQNWFSIYWTSTGTEFPQDFTTLMIVSYFGLRTAVKRLIKTDNIYLNARDSTYRRSALSWAAENAFDVVIELLLSKGDGIVRWLINLLPGRRAEVDSVDEDGRTPLLYAVLHGHVVVVKLLIKAGARVNLKDIIGGTPLSYAGYTSNEEITKLLLKKATPGDLRDRSRWLLVSAAQRGDESILKLLLDTGKAYINAKDSDSRTALHYAARNGNEAIVTMLLDTGKADINAKDNNGRTPLYQAAWQGHAAIVTMLLDIGKADINIKDSDSWTPLSHATLSRREGVVKLLLDTGKADINVKDSNGRTPLLWAACDGNVDIVTMLLDTGKADINAKDSDSRTPLLWAAYNRHKGVVKLLLDTGKADINAKDDDGQTPLYWIKRIRLRGSQEIDLRFEDLP